MAATGDNSAFKSSLRRELVGSFIRNFAVNSTDKYFLFVGKSEGWTAGQTFGQPIDRRSEDVDIRRNIVGMKQIDFNNAYYMAPKFVWTHGNIYHQWDDTIDLTNKAFYVMNSEYNVYKCISNNSSVASTIEPKGIKTTDVIEGGDGYQWKYLFTIPEPQRYYIDDAFIPVRKVNSRGTGTQSKNQWAVQQNANDGGIEFITLTTRNGNYTSTLITPSGFPGINTSADSLAGATGVYLAASHGSAGGIGDDAFNGLVLRITDGNGAGQRRVITDFTASTSLAIFETPLDTAVPSGSKYETTPKVNIYGDGASAEAFALLYDYDGDVPLRKQINEIITTNPGNGYSYADVVFSPSALVAAGVASGTVADARAILSPLGGLGGNAIRELNATAMLIVVNIDQSEDNNFFLENEVRQYGIIKNPILNDTDPQYLNSKGNPYRIAGTNVSAETAIEITSTSTGGFLPESLFTVGNYIVGKDSKATGKIEGWSSALEGNVGIVTVSNLQGNFVPPALGKTGENVIEFTQEDNNWSFASGTNVASVSAYEQNYANTPPSFNCNWILGVTQAGGGLSTNTFPIDVGVTGASAAQGCLACVTGTVLDWTFNLAGTGGTMVVTDVKGSFATGDSIGSYSSASTNAVINTVTPPEIVPKTGEILYAQNMKPIEKDPEQREQYQIILKF